MTDRSDDLGELERFRTVPLILGSEVVMALQYFGTVAFLVATAIKKLFPCVPI